MFEKSTVANFLNYCYGIKNCLDELDLASVLELIRFLNKERVPFFQIVLTGTFQNSSKDGKSTDNDGGYNTFEGQLGFQDEGILC